MKTGQVSEEDKQVVSEGGIGNPGKHQSRAVKGASKNHKEKIQNIEVLLSRLLSEKDPSHH